MIQEFLMLLETGSDVATIGLLLVAWRFDRRMLKIEMHPNLNTNHNPMRKYK